jgi:raffinose/stachyose/melibiose transport system permease protein
MHSKKAKTIISFLFPAILLYTLFVVASIARVIYYSFFKWNGLTGRHFIGLQNYLALMNDSAVLSALKNNLIAIALAVVIQLGLALILAVILSSCKHGMSIYRTIYFFPVIISAVAIAMMFGQFMKPDYGIINMFLRGIGLKSLTRVWLSDPNTAVLASLLPQTLQYVGWHLIILLAGILNIPDSLYEAAYLDGVGYFQKIRYITLPLLWEVLQICIIFAVTGSLQGFTHVMVLTGGGPNSQTELIGLLMYRRTFQWMQFGYGSSVSAAIFGIGLAFSLIFKHFCSSEKIEF